MRKGWGFTTKAAAVHKHFRPEDIKESELPEVPPEPALQLDLHGAQENRFPIVMGVQPS